MWYSEKQRKLELLRRGYDVSLGKTQNPEGGFYAVQATPPSMFKYRIFWPSTKPWNTKSRYSKPPRAIVPSSFYPWTTWTETRRFKD